MYNYYIELFSDFYSEYNLYLSICDLSKYFDFTMYETLQWRDFFTIVFQHSFSSEKDEVDNYSFDDFNFLKSNLDDMESLSIGNSVIEFFSNYYYDYVSFYQWSIFENSLFLYDPRTARISSITHRNVDNEDEREDEDEKFQLLDDYEYYYNEYFLYDSVGV